MLPSKHIPIYLILLLFLLSACSIQKRTYRKGYYIDWKKNNSESHITTTKKNAPAKESLPHQDEAQNLVILYSDNKQEIPTELLQLKNTDQHLIIEKKAPNKDGNCNDTIELSSGAKIIVKILEVNNSVIKYKKCDNLGGPQYEISKTNVKTITYESGLKQTLKPASSADYTSQPKKTNTKKSLEYHPLAVASFVCSLLSLLVIPVIITAPLAVIFGIIALNRINANPGIYKGEIFASFGIVFGIIGCLFIIWLIKLILGFSWFF